MHQSMHGTGEVFFARTASSGDAGDATVIPRPPQKVSLETDPPGGGGKAARRNEGSPELEASGVGQETFLVGEQHYQNSKLIRVKSEEDPMIPSVPSSDYAPPVKCGIAPVDFDEMMKYVESLDCSEDSSTSASVMFASEMLSYYRPKGRLALLSPFLHVSLIIAGCVPTLALFTLW